MKRVLIEGLVARAVVVCILALILMLLSGDATGLVAAAITVILLFVYDAIRGKL